MQLQAVSAPKCSRPPTWRIHARSLKPARRLQSCCLRAIGCGALAKPGLAVTGENSGAHAEPDIKLGTSTPKADPSGDYAFEYSAKPRRSRPAVARRWSGKRCN